MPGHNHKNQAMLRARRASQQDQALVRVSNEAVTYSQIVARTGLSREAAHACVKRLRNRGREVTWDALRQAKEQTHGQD
jgi:biotin operon repressor